MFYPDLHILPEGHPPSPYAPMIHPNEDGELFEVGLPGRTLQMVGWLGDEVPTRGRVTSDVITALLDAYADKAFVSDGTRGWHDCELCPPPVPGPIGPEVGWGDRITRIYPHGHFLIEHEATVFITPVLLPHYIVDHGYCPPESFRLAVGRGRFLRKADLVPLRRFELAAPPPRRPWWKFWGTE